MMKGVQALFGTLLRERYFIRLIVSAMQGRGGLSESTPRLNNAKPRVDTRRGTNTEIPASFKSACCHQEVGVRRDGAGRTPTGNFLARWVGQAWNQNIQNSLEHVVVTRRCR